MIPSSDAAWLSFFNHTYFVLTAAAVVCGGLAVFYSNRVSAAREAEIADLEKSTAQALATAESERLERVRIEQSIAPRRLGEAEQGRLAHSVSHHAGQQARVAFHYVDLESGRFAKDIVLALTAARWEVVGPSPAQGWLRQGSSLELLGIESQGVLITRPRDLRAGLAAESLVAALGSLGFDASVAPGIDQTDVSKLTIAVDFRPAGPQGEAKLRNQNAR